MMRVCARCGAALGAREPFLLLGAETVCARPACLRAALGPPELTPRP
jgi:hypothetical protein